MKKKHGLVQGWFFLQKVKEPEGSFNSKISKYQILIDSGRRRLRVYEEAVLLKSIHVLIFLILLIFFKQFGAMIGSN